MNRNPTDLYTRIGTITKAWSLLRPDKTFNLSLEGFKQAVAGSHETREEVAELEARLQEAKARRDDADKLSRKAVRRVVNAVKADMEDGEDSEIYSAMGYVPMSVAISMRSIRRKDGSKPSDDEGEG